MADDVRLRSYCKLLFSQLSGLLENIHEHAFIFEYWCGFEHAGVSRRRKEEQRLPGGYCHNRAFERTSHFL
jgi:hypothetical protein